MDLALLTLREGRTDAAGPAPLLLLQDSLAAVGGPSLLRHLASRLAAAIAGGRAQAASLTVVALEQAAERYQQLCSLTQVDLAVVDCFSDAFGWGNLLGGGGSRSTDGGEQQAGLSGASSQQSSAAAITSLPGILAAPNSLQQLEQALTTRLDSSSNGGGSSARRRCVVFDSLSPLLDACGPILVAQLLQRLAAAPGTSSLLCGLHSDLHSPADAATAVGQLAAGVLELGPVTELESSLCFAAAAGAGASTVGAAAALAPQGRLTVRLKRRSGRVRTEAQLYCIDADGSVSFVEPPAVAGPGAADKAAAAAAAAGAADGKPSAAALSQQVAGGMKLSLSREEEEARRRVQLPFEHQGQGAAYQTGDWRDYLPPEAGGRAPSRSAASGRASPAAAAAGPALATAQLQQGQQAGQPGQPAGQQVEQQLGQQQGQQQLGRILYVRDSGSEHDSDEDPDDDLDF